MLIALTREVVRVTQFAFTVDEDEIVRRIRHGWTPSKKIAPSLVLEIVRSDEPMEGIADALFRNGQIRRTLRTMTSVSTGLGLLGALGFIGWARYGSHPLRALAAGVIDREANTAAMISVVLGFGGTVLMSAVRRPLFRQLKGQRRALLRLREYLEGDIGRLERLVGESDGL